MIAVTSGYADHGSDRVLKGGDIGIHVVRRLTAVCLSKNYVSEQVVNGNAALYKVSNNAADP